MGRSSTGGRRRGRAAFALRRLLLALVVTAVQVVVVTAVLNVQLETTARGQIYEQATAILGSMDVEATGRSPAELRAEIIAGLERAAGLHLPLPVRVLDRAAHIMVLDFGGSRGVISFAYRRTSSVRAIILVALPNTLVLFGLSSLVAVVLGTWLGALKAGRAGSRFDRGTGLVALLMAGMPTWWVGSLFVLVFVYWLRLFPFGALQSTPPPEGELARLLDRAAHFVLPVLSVSFIRVWDVSFLTRNILLPGLQEDCVMAARGHGLPESRVLAAHVIRPAAPGIAATAIQRLLTAISGDVLVEVVFAFPGIGFLLWGAIRGNDINLATGILATFAALSSLCLALLDIAHAWLDPRIGASQGA